MHILTRTLTIVILQHVVATCGCPNATSTNQRTRFHMGSNDPSCRGLLLPGCMCPPFGSDSQHLIQQVVNLLKDMQKKLEVEAEEDEEVDEKMKCWCKDGLVKFHHHRVSMSFLLPLWSMVARHLLQKL